MPIEQLIEQFVRFPDCLSKVKYDRARKLLQESPEAKEIATYYREYYGMLDEIYKPQSAESPLT